MYTAMILSYLIHERYEHALDRKQGFVSVQAFLRERNHMFKGKKEHVEDCVDLL